MVILLFTLRLLVLWLVLVALKTTCRCKRSHTGAVEPALGGHHEFQHSIDHLSAMC